MLSKVIAFILPEDTRGRKISKNVIGLGLLQGIGLLTSYLLVPLTIDYVSSSQYGIWLTISSIVSWFALLDVGLGTGLRNKLTEALANGDTVLAKKYVSTTYISLTFFVLVFYALFVICNHYIDWAKILHQPSEMNVMLIRTMFIVVTFFAFRLIVQLIGIILTSYLKPAAATAISTTSNVIILLIIWLLSKYTEGSLPLLAFVMSAVPVIAYNLRSLILFCGAYKEIAPALIYFDKTKVRTLLGLGISFFIIKISMIVLFQTSNILIIQMFTNDDVVVYNIAYKLFSIIFILFEIMIQPFWTGYTDAWTKKDIPWIEHTMGKLMKVWGCLAIFACMLLCFSSWIYKIWIGGDIAIPFSLSFMMCIYFICRCYGGTYNIFINGTGKIRLQLISLLFVAVLYIPLVFIFVKVFEWGLLAIPTALILADFYSLFIARIQYRKIVTGTASGIWNR